MTSDLFFTAASLLVWGLGESMFFYFIPLSLQEWGASPVMIGAVLGGVGLAVAIAQIPAGWLSDRYGPRFIMWAGWFVGLLSTLMIALAGSMTVFIIGIWIYYFTAFAVAPMNSYIIQARGKMEVQRALTFVSGCYSLGTIAGPTIGGLIARKYGLSRIYFASFFIFIISSILIVFIKPRQHAVENSSKPSLKIFTNHKYVALLVYTFFMIIILALSQQLTSNFLQNVRELSPEKIGLLGTIGNIGNTFATLVLGGMGQTAGLILGQALTVIFPLALFYGSSVWIFGLGYFMFGGYRLSRNMLVAKIRAQVQDHEVGFAFGILETVSGIAALVTPILAGLFYSINPSLSYAISIPLIFLLILITLFLFRKKALSKKGSVENIHDR